MKRLGFLAPLLLTACLSTPPNPEQGGIQYKSDNETQACQAMVNWLFKEGAKIEELHQWERIGYRESRCNLWAHVVGPRDNSFCWFQINYKGRLFFPRHAAFGNPYELLVNPQACVRAALKLKEQVGWAPWS